ncbi:Hypothetical predicted protein [Marmota monax]|uniref:Uncharacterized protein n=1 Tax=Marmota monax TaxID=9995 RepID=A0A5E4CV51_MARMO|nr:Hypothetical predicted protein [Marmota monax]
MASTREAYFTSDLALSPTIVLPISAWRPNDGGRKGEANFGSPSGGGDRDEKPTSKLSSVLLWERERKSDALFKLALQNSSPGLLFYRVNIRVEATLLKMKIIPY